MFRICFENLDIDIQHDSLDILLDIVASIQSGKYNIQETGWINVPAVEK